MAELAINEETFLAFRDQAHAQLGDFVAIKSVAGSPGENAGVYRWPFQVPFEQADYVVWFGFKEVAADRRRPVRRAHRLKPR